MAYNFSTQLRPDMLSSQVLKPSSPVSGAISKFGSAALQESIAGKFAAQNQTAGATGAQGPTPAPSNPFAGANNPAPTAPNPPPQAAQQAQQAVLRPQQITPRQPMQLGAPAGYPAYRPMPQQSITQQVGQDARARGGAQSVSNYLTALKQAGAGNNNVMMNAPGQMGQQAQAGFRGFGQNGIQTQLGGQFVGPSNMQTGLNWQQNLANASQNYFTGNQAYSPAMRQAGAPQLEQPGGISSVNAPGLLAGAQNAPQYQQPQPWLNQKNMPSNSQQWEDYFYGKYDPAMNPYQQAQPGAMYSPQFERGPDPNAPPPTQEQIDESNRLLEEAANNKASYPWEFWNWSDERLKENINPAQNELEDFMNQLGVYSYEYKNKEHGEGRYVSPMAQEFEKSEIGKSAVITDPKSGYKMVDYGRLMGVQTAALALLNHKYNELEKKFKKAVSDNVKNKRVK